MQGVAAGSGYIWNSLSFWVNQNHFPNLPRHFQTADLMDWHAEVILMLFANEFIAEGKIKNPWPSQIFSKCWKSPLVNLLLVPPSFLWQWDQTWALASPLLWISAPQKSFLLLNLLDYLLTSYPHQRVSGHCVLSLCGIFHFCADVFWMEGFYLVDSQHHIYKEEKGKTSNIKIMHNEMMKTSASN